MAGIKKTKNKISIKRMHALSENYSEPENSPATPAAGYAFKDSKTIFFSGITGGTGCSFIVNCIAAYFAKTRDKNILLLDLQTGKKDSRIIFNISGDYIRDLGDIGCNFSEIDLLVLKKLVINLDSSLNVILPSLKFEKAEIIKNGNLEVMIDALSDYFDLILIDIPHYLFLNKQSSLIDRADRFVFISQADKLSVNNLENLFSNLSCQDQSLKFEIVINKFNQKTFMSSSRILNSSRLPVKIFIPYDKDIDYLYLTRGPSAVFDYSLRTVKALGDLADILYEELFV